MSNLNKNVNTEISLLAKPNMANTIGSIFGGTIMSLMDETAAICARRFSQGRVTTVAVNDLVFIKPLLVGQVINVTASLTRAFKTSLEVLVNVYGEDTYQNHVFLAAKAYYVIVCQDENGRAIKLSEWTPVTEEEQSLWEAAGKRRQNRNNEKFNAPD